MNEKQLKESYGTLSETINELVKLGYNHDFNIKGDCLVCHQTDIVLSPDDFEIDKVYRFEGVSNPDDSSILYAISSAKYGIKGTLVNGYGISSDDDASRLIEKLATNKSYDSVKSGTNDVSDKAPGPSDNPPLLELNLYDFIEQIKSETSWKNNDRASLTLFKSENMRIVLMGLHENAELKPHKTNGVISVQVLQGKINFMTEQQSALIEKGQMITLQENIIHSVKALTESFFLLTLAMKSK